MRVIFFYFNYMAKRKKTTHILKNTVQLNMKFTSCILSENMISLVLQKFRGTLKSTQLEQKYRNQ